MIARADTIDPIDTVIVVDDLPGGRSSRDDEFPKG
jgi:hypothetical protein